MQKKKTELDNSPSLLDIQLQDSQLLSDSYYPKVNNMQLLPA
jgi:hypothetical protein